MDNLPKPRFSIDVYGYDSALLSRTLLPVGAQVYTAEPCFSVAPDASWIVYTQLDSSGSDIEMIDGFR